jgi:hypothetical protein
MSDIIAMTMPLNEIPAQEAIWFIYELRCGVEQLRDQIKHLQKEAITSPCAGATEPCIEIANSTPAKEFAKVMRDLLLNEQRPGGILNPANPKPQIKVVMLRPLTPKFESNCPRTASSFEEGHSVGVEFTSGTHRFGTPFCTGARSIPSTWGNIKVVRGIVKTTPGVIQTALGNIITEGSI